MGNLILTRNMHEGIEFLIDPNCSDEELIQQLRTQGLYVSIAGVRGQQVKIAIEAPPGIRILREELVTAKVRSPLPSK